MAVPGLSCGTRDLRSSLQHAGPYSCTMWTLSCGVWQGTELRPPALGAQSLSHWTTIEVLIHRLSFLPLEKPLLLMMRASWVFSVSLCSSSHWMSAAEDFKLPHHEDNSVFLVVSSVFLHTFWVPAFPSLRVSVSPSQPSLQATIPWARWAAGASSSSRLH